MQSRVQIFSGTISMPQLSPSLLEGTGPYKYFCLFAIIDVLGLSDGSNDSCSDSGWLCTFGNEAVDGMRNDIDLSWEIRPGIAVDFGWY